MNEILVALDGSKNSKRGLAKAIQMAKDNQSKIIGLHIIEMPLSYFVHKSKITIKQDVIKESKKLLNDAKQKCKRAGIDFESKAIPGGDAGYDIVKYAKKRKVATIVIGARGLNLVNEIFLGSVANYVLHKSKIPVLVVK